MKKKRVLCSASRANYDQKIFPRATLFTRLVPYIYTLASYNLYMERCFYVYIFCWYYNCTRTEAS
jgi:hypothetical protein